MGYRGALLRRWSIRDRLAVVVVTVTVAFLTGTVLLVLAAGTQAAAVAAQYDETAAATVHDSPETARSVAGPGDIVLAARFRTPDGLVVPFRGGRREGVVLLYDTLDVSSQDRRGVDAEDRGCTLVQVDDAVVVVDDEDAGL